MLRINLLPAYVAQRRVTRTLLGVYGTLLAILIVGLVGWYGAIAPQESYWAQRNTTAAAAKAAVDAVNSQASSVTSSIAPIQSNLTFVNQVHEYNLAYIKMYQTVANYTSPKILYNAMDIDGTNMDISGYTPSLSELGRYLLEMYKEPDATDVELTTPIPGYNAANPDTPVTETIPAPAAGKLPGYPLPVHSYTIYRGKIVAVNTGAAAGGVGGFGGFQGQPQGGMVGLPPGLNAAAGASGRLFDPRRDGFPFSVVLVMKSVPAPPAPPGTPVVVPVGAGGGQLGGVGGGGFGGPPGGFGGGGFGPGGPPPGFMGPRGALPPGYGAPPPGAVPPGR